MNPIIRGNNDVPPQNQQPNQQYGQQPRPPQNPYYPQQPDNQPPYRPQNPPYPQNRGQPQYPQRNPQYPPNADQQPYPPQYPPQNMGPAYGRDERPKGTWQATGPQMNDMQAHRDARYQLPNQFMQTISVFKTQMSLFSKRKIIYILLLMAVLIPIVYNLIKDQMNFYMFTEMSGNGMMGAMLFMLPLVLGVFTSFLCGSLMPSEINERTAYMNMALPMSRASFCLGKYLASVVITLGVFIFAYGMSMLTATSSYSYFDESGLGLSFISIILSVLVYTSFSFAMGCIMKRGSTIVSLLSIVAILPGIEFYLFVNKHIDSGSLSFFPNLLSDITCMELGSSISSSPIGIMNLIMGSSGVNVASIDMGIATLFALIWTVAFLALGIFAISRREM